MTSPAPQIIPTLGRIVLFKLASWHANEINERRKDYEEKAAYHSWKKNGTLVSRGNSVEVGQLVPAMVVAVWGNTPQAAVNLKLFLDGSDDHWVTSVCVGEREGDYQWMDYQKGQAAKTEKLQALLEEK